MVVKVLPMGTSNETLLFLQKMVIESVILFHFLFIHLLHKVTNSNRIWYPLNVFFR